VTRSPSPSSDLEAAPTSTAGVYPALVLVQILFATHYVASKIVVETFPPRVWAAMRVVGAAALLYALMRARGQRLPRGALLWVRFAIYALLGVVINQVCFVEGIKRTTPIQAALIMTSIPVLTLFLAVLLRQERVTWSRALAFALALAGLLLLLRVETLDFADIQVRGNILTLINAMSFSAFLVVSRPTLRVTPSLPATCLLFLLGSPPVIALALPEMGGVVLADVSAQTWWLAAYIIVFPTLLAYLLNYWALRRTTSSTVAFFIYLQPLATAGLSVFLLGEAITPRKVVSFLLVAMGIAVVAGSARNNAQKRAAG